MRSSAVQRLLGAGDTIAEVSALRQRVREKVSELKEDIQELNEYHNSLSPANSLPPEILANIFEIHRTQHNADQAILCIPKGSLAWIRVTHVCHRWREVAIDCPSLWSALSFRHPEFTEIMLRRSRDTLLDIVHSCAPIPPEGLFPIMHKALSQTERLRTAHLNLDVPAVDITIYSSILADLTTSAPYLKSLALTSYELEMQEYPDNFLGGHAPSLKELTLTRFPPSFWKAIPFGSRSLKSLTIRSPPGPGPTIEDFVDALRLMPDLLKMDLWNNIPRTRPGSLHPETRITLPALEDLQISDSLTSIHDFFAIVSLPKLTTIHLTISTIRTGNKEALSQCLGALKSSCDTFRRGALTTFCIEETYNGGTQFTFGGDVSLDLTLYYPTISLQEFVTIYHDQLDLSVVSTLSIVKLSSMSADGETWAATLSSLPGLKHISIESSFIEEFLDALKIRPDAGSPRHLPALSRLALKDVPFFLRELDDTGDPSTPATISGLIDGLRVRDEICPVHTLKIASCVGFVKQDYLRIQAEVPRVNIIWDGFTKENSDDGEFQEF